MGQVGGTPELACSCSAQDDDLPGKGNLSAGGWQGIPLGVGERWHNCYILIRENDML